MTTKPTMNEQQKQLLSEPLQKSAVKERSGGGGRSLSYIEGWHAIAEANRIFEFDGWASETVSMECVGNDGGTVSYVCKVRVTVDGIIREGWGAGHGRGGSAGDRHESAVKEAETDARKRALMTFGNQFGLALYDKTKSNVQDSKTARLNTVDAQSAEEIKYLERSGKLKPQSKFEQQKEWIKTADKTLLGEANIKLAKATGLTDAQKLELRQMIEERLLAK